MKTQPLITRLRDWLENKASPEPLPEGIHQIAARHRVNGILYHIAATLCESDAQEARRAWTQNLAGHLARSTAFDALWPKGGPPPLVIKGADLAENLFDDPGARQCVDLDLLLPEPLFQSILEQLPATARTTDRPRHERFEDDPEYAIGLRYNDTLIELHRCLQPVHRAVLDPQTLYERAQPGLLGERAVLYPSVEDRLKIWLVNHSKTGFRTDLSDMIDLGLILDAIGHAHDGFHGLHGIVDNGPLRRAFELAIYQFKACGLAPEHLQGLNSRWHPFLQLMASIPAHRPSSFIREQSIKLWLSSPAQRLGTLSRAASTMVRRRGLSRRPS